jgi:hypothetical protein
MCRRWRAVLAFWENLFSVRGAFDAEQLSERGVRSLLELLPQVQTEIVQFVEPTCRIMLGQHVFIPNLLGEFRDSSIAIVYGKGRGHALVRVSALFCIARNLQSNNLNWSALVRALEREHFRIKRIGYFSCEDVRR